MTDRAARIEQFLDRAGWRVARRARLAGDASARQYTRLHLPGATAILMDCPPGQGEDPLRFIRVAEWLLAQGYSAPRILARDVEAGLLLLEDLGEGLLAHLTAADPTCEAPLYAAVADFLADLHTRTVPGFVVPLDGAALASLLAWVDDWYIPALGADPLPELPQTVARLYTELAGLQPHVLSMRDFHAENLLWLPDRMGHARLGLLDFQDTVAAHPAYDLVSLLQDARRDVGTATEAATVARYIAGTGWNSDAFGAIYALLGAQRALRILAVFARLCLHLGRPRYLDYVPRVWGHLQRNLAHPALADLARVAARLPEPTPDALARLRGMAPCPTR